MNNDRHETAQQWLYPLLIICAVAAVFLPPALGSSFLMNWDDNKYVVQNAAAHGFSLDNLRAAFSSFYVGNYAPVHIVSYMLDYTLWGLNPLGYRGVNIALHAANALLFYRLLCSLGERRETALLAALLFALHPVQVESVAWISQRKNVLAMFFSLISFSAYIQSRHADKPGAAYGISLTTFALALLTKSIAVILPPAYILYDLLVRHERNWRGSAVRTLPYLALAAGCGALALVSQQEARTDWHGGTPGATLFSMLPVAATYLRMIVWPRDLSPLYDPVIRHSLTDPAVLASLMLLVVSGAGIVWLVRRHPAQGFWACFAVLGILPVSQIVPLTTMMNDRYLYVPMLGVAALFASWTDNVGRHRPVLRRVLAGCWLAALCLLAVLSTRQGRIWHDAESLWASAVQAVPGSRFARQGLAEVLEKKGELPAAALHYQAALERDPASPELNAQAGVVYARLGDFARAVPLLHNAVRLRPDNITYGMNLASALLQSGAYHEAIAQLLQLDRSGPTPRTACMLGALYEKTGDARAAAAHYNRAAILDAGQAQAECSGIRSVLRLP